MAPPDHVTCPGCKRNFEPGRSMSVHLYQSPQCRPDITSTASNDSQHRWSHQPFDTCIPKPVTTVPFTEFPTAEELFPNSNFCDPDASDDGELSFDVDDVLQDVASFAHGYTSAQKHEAELLKLIHAMGAPNGAFESIMSWAKTALESGYDFQPSPIAYHRQITQFEKLVGMTACRPSRVSVNMYRPDMVEDILDVVVFDFPTMLASLFNCPVLNKIENLVVNPHDRFHKYESPDGLLGEVNSGTWYDTAYSNLIKNPDKDFMCPIIFAMDKTVISEMAGLSVLVILFTSSVFNREVCTPLIRSCLFNVLCRGHSLW
jgi:hypothetical protein